jgi:hypothetical protein
VIDRCGAFYPRGSRPNRVRRPFRGCSSGPNQTERAHNAFSDVIETGANTRQTELTIRPRGRVHHSSRWCPVERGAARVARHVRERLLEVIPGHQPGVISRFYLMVSRAGAKDVRRWTPINADPWDLNPHPRSSASVRGSTSSPRSKPSANAGERDRLCRAIRRSGRIQSGCRSVQGALPIPQRAKDQSLQGHSGAMPVRFVERMLASGAGRWQHRPAGGVTTSGVLPRKADREKLNDERGSKPLPVSRSRDGAGSGQAGPGWVRKRFCILLPEIVPRSRDGNCAGAGASNMPGRSGHQVLTNVTAVAESPSNRARSVAAGVVSGAGVQSAGDPNAAL